MRVLLAVLLLSVSTLSHAARESATEMVALCYHDVVTDTAQTLIDPMAITVDTLISHLSWLKGNGYTPITLAQWRAAADGAPLPQKPVLLTFDDGYRSFQEYVLPLLELFGTPAVLAPVTGWVDTPADRPVAYGDELKPRDHFLTWTELAEIAESGLVELASHSHDLHRGIRANPQGNLLPAAAVHAFDADRGAYESDQAYGERIGADLRASAHLMRRHLGRAPDVMVWPYGAHNATARAAAAAAGMDVSLTLDDAANRPGSDTINRVLISADTDLANLASTVQEAFGERDPRPQSLRAANIELDRIYHADPNQTKARLDALLDRIKDLQISAVFLLAYSDPDDDGVADALYFPNRHLPMRADLFSRVAWQLYTRADVEVFARMPVAGFAGLAGDRHAIREIYDDLGRSGRFQGVLYQARARAAHAAAYSDASFAFTDELSRILERWQPALKTARTLPADSGGFAADRLRYLAHYDYAAIDAPPDGQQLQRLVNEIQMQQPHALSRLVFNLYTRDDDGGAVSNERLRRLFDLLLRAGARNIAYYPDDFAANHPDLALLRSRLSVNTHPALKK